jgi:hypothetical protein
MHLVALRASLLGVAIFFCAASASTSQESGPPTMGPGGPGGGWFCHNAQGPTGKVASMCRPSAEDCERERQASADDGLKTSVCAAVSPVFCFQALQDPTPAAAWCAATVEDCEYWREVDRQKNQSSPPACESR